MTSDRQDMEEAASGGDVKAPPPDPSTVLTYNGQPYGYLISGPPPPPYEPPQMPTQLAPLPLPRSYPNTCCCGCSLKTGTIIAGSYITVYGACILVYLILLDLINIADPYHFRRDFAFLHFIAVMAYAQVASGTFVVFGAHKNRPSYMKPWLIFSAFKNTLILAALVFGTSVLYRRLEQLIVITAGVGSISVGIDLYCNVVVFSFYKHRRIMVPNYLASRQEQIYPTP
ncbi:uncharacterized protein [Anabrus simplex]|uniref:uncharacterized protein isoform X2 n=1 Tax=Anabrus simplex TaxID=316456 RepID=UPI0034DD330D